MINNKEVMEIDLTRDPYQIIHNFINESIISKQDCLIRCDRFNEDEMGNPAIEFFIRYCPDMPYEKEDKLFMKIISEIHTFCNEHDLNEELFKCSLFVTVAGDCRGYE